MLFILQARSQPDSEMPKVVRGPFTSLDFSHSVYSKLLILVNGLQCENSRAFWLGLIITCFLKNINRRYFLQVSFGLSTGH